MKKPRAAKKDLTHSKSKKLVELTCTQKIIKTFTICAQTN